MGTQVYIYAVTAILSYLVGSIASSIIIGKKMAGIDVRNEGSGNAGSTNVLRTVGKRAAAITLICDILKGVVAIWIAKVTAMLCKGTDVDVLIQVASIAVIVGHTLPVFFKFKGGKGVATALGIILMTNWKIGLICLIFALVLMVITKMVSLGSIAAAALFPILTIFIGNANYIVFSIILAAIVIINHRKNIKRILTGTEKKLGKKLKTEE